MPKVIDVVYKDGVFKPLTRVDIREGERLKIEIKETKKLSKEFYDKLADLKRRTPKVRDANRVLEEMRSDRY